MIQRILKIFIGYTSRSSLNYNIGEGNDSERNGLHEDAMIEYPLVNSWNETSISFDLTIRRHMEVTEKW